MQWVWKDGQLCPEDEAVLSVRDGAVLHGASLFETLRCYQGRPFRLEAHLLRLRRWMERLHLFVRARRELNLDAEAVRQAIGELLEANGLLKRDSRLRITVTAGAEGYTPSCFLLAEGIDDEQIRQWQRGVHTVLMPDPRAMSGEVPKWGSYAWHIEAYLQAQAQGAGEVIWFRDSYLTEGALSSLFVYDDDRLLSPPLEEGILAGITRQVVFEIAEQTGIRCVEERLPIRALHEAQAVFLTNSVREIVPVLSVDGRPLASHPIIHQLQQAYTQLVQQETGTGQ